MSEKMDPRIRLLERLKLQLSGHVYVGDRFKEGWKERFKENWSLLYMLRSEDEIKTERLT